MSTNSKSHTIGRGLLTGLLVTLLILFVKWCVEHTKLYHGYQKATYSWLLSRLEGPHRREDLPIVVLDIRALEYETKEVQGEKFLVTPRQPLMDLIEAVVAQKPKAVGVDIDFSPNKFGFGDPANDPIHFRRLLKLRQDTGVPIYLGVHRSQHRKQELWLGHPEFASLAANISKPDDNRRMYEWVSASGSDGEVAEHEKGLTMSKALASALGAPDRHVSPPASWLVHASAETRTGSERKASDFLVDFSALDDLRDYRLTTINPNSVREQRWLLENKAVLIGDGTPYVGDTVIVPLASESDSVPGVYLHASAAYTLVRGPLYELSGLGRFVADLLLALIVLTGVVLARAYVQKMGGRLAEKRTSYILVALVTVIAIVFGVILLQTTRLMWDDFVFVLLALWIHPAIEGPLWRFLSWIKTNTPVWLRKVFTEKGTEEAA